MPTYVPILDAEIDPESPVTVSLMTRMRDNALAYLGAPSGTKIVTRQATAPLGWTNDNTYDDRVLRLSSTGVSQGGSVAFSTLFGRTATDAFTIAQSNLPSANFTLVVNINDPGHPHSYTSHTALVNAQAGGGVSNLNQGEGTGTSGSNTTGITASGTAASGGSGSAITAPIDMRVAYADVKIVTKD